MRWPHAAKLFTFINRMQSCELNKMPATIIPISNPHKLMLAATASSQIKHSLD